MGRFSGSRLGDVLARAIGWRAAMVAEPAVFDRWRWMRRLVRPGVRTLDAGCGSGWFAFYLASRGNQVIGMSFNPVAIAAAQRRASVLGEDKVRFMEGDLRELETIGPELGNFDQIVCFETIEHILDDDKLVRDLADRLAPGGLLMMTSPSDNHHPLLGESHSDAEDGGHMRHGYSQERMRELCENAGLAVRSEVRLTGWLGQKLYNGIGRLMPVLGFRLAIIVMALLRPLQLLDRPLNKLIRYPEWCVAIAAEKPRA